MPDVMGDERTAAMLVIGNEVLTGKVEEQNVAVLARCLFDLGITLRRVVVCVDEIDVIARDIDELRRGHDLVFTSGGVGPTHDDVTVDGVAAAFDRKVVRSAEVERLIRGYHEAKGEPVTEAHLRMANVVEGCRLLRAAALPWPTLVIDDVYVLPGVPAIFRMKLDVLKDELDRGESFASEAVYTMLSEGEIAATLHELTEAHPEVLIGSYLAFREPRYRVKVTFDSRNEAAARAAADALRAALPEGELVDVEEATG
jgi:molybdenum cofactor synthesis domain-containing protein